MDAKTINRIYVDGEIAKVSDNGLRRFLTSCVDRFPDYFWEAPASNVKHHPPDERKVGGLVLHVRRLVKLTEHMARFHRLNAWERDVLLAACVLHDGFARGIPPRELGCSDPLHAVYVPYMFPFNADADRFIERRVYEEIMECVASHQGPWAPTELLRSNRKLPMIFQMIDFIGSREDIAIEL